jgi:hypothetical protein
MYIPISPGAVVGISIASAVGFVMVLTLSVAALSWCIYSLKIKEG